MKRSSFNFIVDASAFAGFVFLTTTGILIHYILPAGTGRFAEIWGLDRHGWGVIHYWVAVITLALLTLHVFLHHEWIVNFVKGHPRESSGNRFFLGVVGFLSLIALAVAPFFGSIEKKTDTWPSKMQNSSYSSGKSYVINGKTTLQEAEKATGVPVRVILNDLKLPANISRTESFGRLEKQYNFSIQDVRNIIDKHVPKAQDK